MSMKLLASHDQGVANLPTHEEEDDLAMIGLNIIEDAEVSDSEFEFGQRIGAEPLDRPSRGRRLVRKSSEDCGSQESLLAYRQSLKLGLRLPCQRDQEGH